MRRRRADKRNVVPDSRFGSELIAKMVNSLMERGKKSTAERIVYGALEQIKEITNEEPIAVMNQAIDNVKPRLEVKSRRVGGATYQVPVEVSPDRQVGLALRWQRWQTTGEPALARAARSVPLCLSCTARMPWAVSAETPVTPSTPGLPPWQVKQRISVAAGATALVVARTSPVLASAAVRVKTG